MSTPALDYINAGLVLVAIPRGLKGPRVEGWNRLENCITTIEQAAKLNGGNIGLAHTYARTCAIDFDNFEKGAAWLTERGVDVAALMMRDDAVQIISGRANRAKLLYRLPDGVEPLPTKKLDAIGLELRCATSDGLTVQDVLPPSIHPDTGQSYKWRGNWRQLPTLPGELLTMWRDLLASTGGKSRLDYKAVLAGVPEGARDETLFKYAASLQARKVPLAEALVLAEHAALNCIPPFDARAARRKVESVYRHYQPPAGSYTSSIIVRRIADVAAERIQWLWENHIARGKLTAIAGDPGLGKSQLTTSMAAVTSTGGRWPVDRTPCAPGSVVILSAEDGAADTIRPRLEAADADLARCFVIDAVRDVGERGESRQRGFSLDKDAARLGTLLDELGDVALVIVDPISAYLGGIDSHNNAEVRGLLAPLAKVAEEHAAAFVLVSHLTKGANTKALMKIMGSLAFVAAARAAFVVARDPDDDSGQRRLFLPVKNNLAPDSEGLAFRIEGVTLPNGIATSRVSWEAEAVTMTADEALAPRDEDRAPRRREAEEWLRMQLASGPMSQPQLEQNAKVAGLSWATVRIAKQRLGVKSRKVGGRAGKWEWELRQEANDAPQF